MINGNSPLLKDISVTLNPDTPEWPGDTPFTCGWSSLSRVITWATVCRRPT